LLAKYMVEVPSGSFVRGSDAHYPEESPAHEEHVAAFVSYQHPVANAEFRRFVSEAGYRTRATPPVEDISGGDAAVLVAGSLIFPAAAIPRWADRFDREFESIDDGSRNELSKGDRTCLKLTRFTSAWTNAGRRAGNGSARSPVDGLADCAFVALRAARRAVSCNISAGRRGSVFRSALGTAAGLP
jgi:formylglycine-generating enzyme required for sulfatase activity